MGNNNKSGNQKNLISEKIFSVIIPTYQEEKLIERTLSQFDSNIKNKYNLEIIVSDGGSEDGTITIAKKYADKVIENWSGEKQNISIGRNRGASVATGRYFVFLNADTLIENIAEFFENILEKIESEKFVGVTCPVYVYPEEEKFKDRFFHIFLNIYFFTLNILGLGMGRGECQVLSREMFIKLGGYNERIAAGEDFDLFRRLRHFGKIKFLWNQKVYESPRRYRKYGYLRIILIWLFNAIFVLFTNKSLQSEWKPIR